MNYRRRVSALLVFVLLFSFFGNLIFAQNVSADERIDTNYVADGEGDIEGDGEVTPSPTSEVTPIISATWYLGEAAGNNTYYVTNQICLVLNSSYDDSLIKYECIYNNEVIAAGIGKDAWIKLEDTSFAEDKEILPEGTYEIVFYYDGEEILRDSCAVYEAYEATATPTVNTPEPTAVDTIVPTITDTPDPTATDTPVPTSTDTPVPTATDTPIPTATNTPTPTATPAVEKTKWYFTDTSGNESVVTYTNATQIDLEIWLDYVPSDLTYECRYNGNVIYSGSGRDAWIKLSAIESFGGMSKFPSGEYVISFYTDGFLLYEDSCIVNVINTPTATPTPTIVVLESRWYFGGFEGENIYSDTDKLDLDLTLNFTPSNLRYECFYNNEVIATGTGRDAYIGIADTTLITVDGLFPLGVYTITFYVDNQVIFRDTCTVKVAPSPTNSPTPTNTPTVTPTPCTEVTFYYWYYLSEEGNQENPVYSSTTSIDLYIRTNNGITTGISYKCFYDGEVIYSGYGTDCNVKTNNVGLTLADGCLPSGTYTITFYYEDEVLFSDSCVVIAVPTSTPVCTSTPAPTKVPETGVAGFVERLYTCCLDRESEPEGKEYWISCLNYSYDGYDVAKLFFFSEELESQNISNIEYLIRLYTTFLNRSPESNGFIYWLNLLDSGVSREYVFEGFINSPEWNDICASYGIRSGGAVIPDIEINATRETITYVARVYSVALGRDADAEGLKIWAEALSDGSIEASVLVRGVIGSDEFTNLNLSDEEYLIRLYRICFSRPADVNDSGYLYWLGKLTRGTGREDVLNYFIASDEFASVCQQAGVNP